MTCIGAVNGCLDVSRNHSFIVKPKDTYDMQKLRVFNTVADPVIQPTSTPNYPGSKALFHRFRAYFRVRKDYGRLQTLPDYLLDDVGLSRDQITRPKLWPLL